MVKLVENAEYTLYAIRDDVNKMVYVAITHLKDVYGAYRTLSQSTARRVEKNGHKPSNLEVFITQFQHEPFLLRKGVPVKDVGETVLYYERKLEDKGYKVVKRSFGVYRKRPAKQLPFWDM